MKQSNLLIWGFILLLLFVVIFSDDVIGADDVKVNIDMNVEDCQAKEFTISDELTVDVDFGDCSMEILKADIVKGKDIVLLIIDNITEETIELPIEKAQQYILPKSTDKKQSFTIQTKEKGTEVELTIAVKEEKKD